MIDQMDKSRTESCQRLETFRGLCEECICFCGCCFWGQKTGKRRRKRTKEGEVEKRVAHRCVRRVFDRHYTSGTRQGRDSWSPPVVGPVHRNEFGVPTTPSPVEHTGRCRDWGGRRSPVRDVIRGTRHAPMRVGQGIGYLQVNICLKQCVI